MRRLKLFQGAIGVTVVMLFWVGTGCANNLIQFDENSAFAQATLVQPVEPTAPATLPPDDVSGGVIYFVNMKRDKYLNIETIEFYKIDPDGANLTLIHSYRSEEPVAGFVVSPDGQKIAYSSLQGDEIYVISVDGGSPINLTNTPEWSESNPTWSPDGQRIAYDRGPYPPPDPADPLLSKHDIYIMNADGTDPLNLTHNPAQHYSHRPVWSPDGQYLAFISTKPEGDLAITDLYLIKADGTNSLNLTASLDNDPTNYEWSADGQQLRFSTFDYNSYIVNADSTGLVQVTLPRLPASDFSGNLKWSPDGQRMSLCGYAYPYCTLFTMNSDGTSLTRISADAMDIWNSAWSPDGWQLAFAATPARPGRPRSALYVVNLATLSGQSSLQPTRLTVADFEEIGPIRWWAPPGNSNE